MAREYKWGQLRERGNWVHHPDTLVNQVARLAKKYVERNLPPGSQVTTVTVPDGTVTFLSYVPPTVVEEPRTQTPEPPAKTKRQLEQEAKAEERRQKDAEREEENRKAAVAGRKAILKDVEGHAVWHEDLSSEERAHRQDRWARAKENGASAQRLEDILTGDDGDED